MGQGGKRAGKRAGPKKQRSFDRVLLALAVGVTFCVVAWGYLVKAAIDFGTSARGGDATAWAFLGLASLGGVACLFVGLMLVARITRRLGITRDPGTIAPVRRIEPGLHVEFPDDTAEVPSLHDVPAPPAPRRAAGGRRAAR